MPLKSNYNFVPLNENIYIPAWWNNISNDVPLSDGEDGIIEVSIKNYSPICVCDSNSRDKKESLFSSHIKISNDEKLYFIPSTTIKGMLRSTLEILSFGRLSQFNDDYFGRREIGKEFSGGSYMTTMKKVECGWLKKNDDEFILFPCDGEFKRISHSEIKKILRSFDSNGNAEFKQKQFQVEGDLFPSISIYKDYRIVFTGCMKGKENEYLFPRKMLKGEIIPNLVKKKFLTVYKPSPIFESYYLNILKEGGYIPVFFIKDNNGNLDSIGLSRLYRYPYKQSVADGINQKSCNSIPDANDLCEIIFGCSANESTLNLRGRLQVEHAFCSKVLNDEDLIALNPCVLGKPKASYYPLYLKQDKSPYNTYDDHSISISGRKNYRVRSGVVELPQGEKNEKVKTCFRPIPSDQCFKFKVHIHNMKPMEIGAILSALTFHNTKGIFHTIGLAKGYGYGKVACSIEGLVGLSRSVSEYLSEFEKTMNDFTITYCDGEMWTKTKNVQTLLGIHSEHKDCELLKPMTLKEYGENKKNQNFNTLDEICISPFSLKTEFESITFKSSLKILYSKANTCVANQDFSNAISIYLDIIDRCKKKELIIDEEKKQVEEWKNAMDCLRKDRIKAFQEAEEEKLKDKLNSDLCLTLDELYVIGPKEGMYKVNDIKVCMSKIEQRFKALKLLELNSKDIFDLHTTLSRLSKNKNKKEIKSWIDFNSKDMWMKIRSWIGGKLASEWFEEFNS